MFDDRLKKLRIARGLSQAQVAKELGIPQKTYCNYERNEREPSSMTLFHIARYYGVTLDYLLDFHIEGSRSNTQDENFILSDSEKTSIKKYRTLDEYGKRLIDESLEIEYERCENANKPPIVVFRRLSANKASAGYGYDLNDPDGWKELDVIDTPEARQADFAVEIDGRSMEPTYYDGDIVYIEVAKEIPVGQIGLFVQNGQGFIKEVGEECLISHNDDYPDILPDDGEITCIGRVIGTAELP